MPLLILMAAASTFCFSIAYMFNDGAASAICAVHGTIFLIVCWFRNAKGQFTPNDHFGFEAAAWYWHFVDVVWLFLFTAVYWWGSAA